MALCGGKTSMKRLILNIRTAQLLQSQDAGVGLAHARFPVVGRGLGTVNGLTAEARLAWIRPRCAELMPEACSRRTSAYGLHCAASPRSPTPWKLLAFGWGCALFAEPCCCSPAPPSHRRVECWPNTPLSPKVLRQLDASRPHNPRPGPAHGPAPHRLA